MRHFAARVFGARLFTPRLFGRATAAGATEAVAIAFRVAPDLGADVLDVSGLDDLFARAVITGAESGAVLASGTVALELCARGSTTLIDPGATFALSAAAGAWTVTLDGAALTTAMATLTEGTPFDMLLNVQGRARRRVRKCRKVAVADA